MTVFEKANGQHINSYYAATAVDSTDFPTLDGDIEAEVCIVGGGFAGLSAAIELAENGYDVALIEAVKTGWAASGRNGGQILGGWTYSYDEIEAEYGADTARMFMQLSEEGRDIIHQRAEKFNIDADIKKGFIVGAMNKAHLARFEEAAEDLEKWNYPHQFSLVSQQDVKQYIDSDAYVGALVETGNGHFHPLKFAIGEAKAAASLGVTIYEHSPVTEIKGGDEPTVITARGKIKAKQIILAGNCYLEKVAPALEKKIIPIGTYIITTEPLGEERAKQLIPQGQAVVDARNNMDYYRITADNRLLFGGKGTINHELPKNIIKKIMTKDMLKIFPQLANVKVDYAWGGAIDMSLNSMPYVGEYADNVYFTQGFSGHGVVATHIAGRVLAEKVMGKTERYDVWSQTKHANLPGGTLLRKPGFYAGMGYYMMLDMINAIRG